MESFLHDHAIYVVLGIALILWLGISLYIFLVDKKLNRLEQQVADKYNDENSNIN
jgi:CcmD family protein